MINLRNALMAGKRLPYDAEVEYLESTGTQWIDTGITNYNTTWSSSIVFSLTSLSSTFIGLYGARTTNRNGIYLTLNNQYVYSVNGMYSTASPIYLYQFIINKIYEVKTENSKRYLNGSEITTGTLVSSTIPVGVALYLFAANDNNQNIELSNGLRIYRYSIYNGSDKICDFIPVRFTNELGQTEGAMYDRVSGKLYGNQGTGAFIIGPDKVSSVGGGYKRKCIRRSYRRSSRPSARFWQPRLWKEVA